MGLDRAEGVPVEAEFETGPRIARDAPSVVELKIRDDDFSLMLVETTPPSD